MGIYMTASVSLIKLLNQINNNYSQFNYKVLYKNTNRLISMY